ncbi:MAG: TonB family protein [Chitinivibrionales bacterium]
MNFPEIRCLIRPLMCLALLYTTGFAQTDDGVLERDGKRAGQPPAESIEMPEVSGEAGQEMDEEMTEHSQKSGEAPEEEQEELPPIEKMPELVSFVEADYPKDVYSEGIEGNVLMTLLVSDSGSVDSVWVDQGVHPILDSSAVKAAQKFEFEPAEASGQPVAVYLQYEYRFSLQEVAQDIEPMANFGGKLIERGTRAPVPDAMVVITFLDTTGEVAGLPFELYRKRIGEFEGQYLEEDRLVTMSDTNGEFTFFSLPTAEVALSVPAAGYEMFTDTFQVNASEEVRMEFYLHRLDYSNYEIVVYGKTSKKEVSRRQLSLNEVKKIPGLGGDAVKVVQALPGVGRPTMGFGDVVVRGAPTWDSRFYLDGINLPAIYHFGGLKSVYNSDGLEDVSFYPGGFGTRYGGGIAGVIELTSRKPKTDRWHGSADVSTLDASFLVEGPVNENLSVMGSARRSFIGDLVSWYVDNAPQDLPFSVSPFYWDYLLKVNYDVDENLSLFATFLGSRDSLNMHIEGMQGGSEEIDEQTDKMGASLMFHLAMLGVDWKISKMFTNTFRYGFNYWDNQFSVFGQMKTKNISYDHHLRDQFDIHLGEKFTVSTGIDLYLMNLDLQLAIPQEGGLIRRDTVDNWLFGTLGGYSFLEWRPIKDLQIIGGLRYDFFPELDYHGSYLPEFWNYEDIDNTTRFSGEPSARLNMRYSINDNHIIKGAVGNYSQTPQPVGQVIMKGWGDPHLPATKAAHYVLGYEWQISDLIRADIQGYINNQWNIPRMADPEDFDPDAIDGEALWLEDGKARMHGVELMLRHDQGKRFFGWLAYTLSRSERYDNTEKKYVLYGEDQTHHLQLVGNWRLARQWESGFRFRYVTGKPTTPVIGKIENETYSYFEPITGEVNSDRLDPFVQLDLRVEKKFVFDKWLLSGYLDLQNISYFLYKSPEFTWYDAFYEDKTTVSNIFQPGIGVKAEF